MPTSDNTLHTPTADKLRAATESFTKSDAKLEAELTGEQATVEQHRSSLVELRNRVIDPPTLENASAVEIAVKATERLISQGETRIRAIIKKRDDLAKKHKAKCEGIDAGAALAFGEKQNAATVVAARGKIAEIDLLAAAFAADLDCPAGIEPRPSRQINAALDAIVREHFAGHIVHLKFDAAEKGLRDLLTAEPRAAAKKARAEALEAIKREQSGGIPGVAGAPMWNTLEGARQIERALERKRVQGAFNLDSQNYADCQVRGQTRYEAYIAPFTARIAAAEETYRATIAELDSLPLENLVERYAAAAKEQLEIEANAAADRARKIEPNEVEIRAASGLLPVGMRSVEQCRQFAQELAARAAHDAVTGTLAAPVFAIPERPTCERPAKLDHYRELLAPYLADPPPMPNQIQLDCQAECVAKYGTAALSEGATA